MVSRIFINFLDLLRTRMDTSYWNPLGCLNAQTLADFSSPTCMQRVCRRVLPEQIWKLEDDGSIHRNYGPKTTPNSHDSNPMTTVYTYPAICPASGGAKGISGRTSSSRGLYKNRFYVLPIAMSHAFLGKAAAQIAKTYIRIYVHMYI